MTTPSFEDAPDFSVGAQYFLAAPMFAAVAGLLLAWLGGAVFASRYTPGILALTHLLTVGALAMAMAGALWQILPVVAGATVPHQALLAAIVWRALLVGAPALALTFLSGSAPWIALAAVALVTGLGGLAGGAIFALARSTQWHASALGIRCALGALLVTICLGLALAGHWQGWWQIDFLAVVDLHASWGLLGWIGMLVLAVGLQVIPMFQVTPSYPPALAWSAAPAAVALLAVRSASGLMQGEIATLAGRAAEYALAAIFLAFAAISLRLLMRRKRPTPNVGTRYWRLAFACLLAATALQASGMAKGEGGRDCLLGVMYLAGFALSAVYGMLFRIVPFLAWYHLQSNLRRGDEPLPSVRDMLSEVAAVRQFHLHLAATIALALTPILPVLARPAGLLAAAAALWQFALLWRVVKIYRRYA
ncbi:MAG TPA: permease [Burkholderiaceae bacterium]